MARTFDTYDDLKQAVLTELRTDDPESIISAIITPALAQILLDRDPRNRKERPGYIKRYARLMAAGQWNPAISEALMFLESGRLANGQHRLKAVVLSGIPMVARLIKVSTTMGTDEGITRTLPDELVLTAHVPEVDKAITAAIVTALYRDDRPSLTEQLTFYAEHRELIQRCIDIPRQYLAEKDALRRKVIPMFLLSLAKARAVFLERVPEAEVDSLFFDVVEGGLTNPRAKLIFDHLVEVHANREKGVTPRKLAEVVKTVIGTPPGTRMRNPWDRKKRQRRVKLAKAAA